MADDNKFIYAKSVTLYRSLWFEALLFFQLTKFGPQWPMNAVSSDLLVNWDVAFISLAC